MNYIRKEGGVHDLPVELRKVIYDFIHSIDLDKDDRDRSEGNFFVHTADEVPGVGLVVYDDKVVALIKMGVYDLETRSIHDEAVMAAAIPRSDIERLIVEEKE